MIMVISPNDVQICRQPVISKRQCVVLLMMLGLGLPLIYHLLMTGQYRLEFLADTDQWASREDATPLQLYRVVKKYFKALSDAVASNQSTTSIQVSGSRTTSTDSVTKSSSLKCRDPFREEFVKMKNFICIHPIGRIGNNLFIYASAYGIASHLNRTVVMNNDTVFYKYFTNIKATIVGDYSCVIQDAKRKRNRQGCAFDERMMDIPKGENYCVGSYLQSYKYFEHVEEDLKKQLIFKEEYKRQAMVIIENAIQTYKNRFNRTASKESPTLVGVHVRRGDFVNHKFGYDVATPQYMKKALNYFRDRFPFILFLVCSNDMRWSKKYVRGHDVIHITGNHFSTDLAVLVNCNHTVTTVGTFSWWAGYLTGGITLYYQWLAREGSRLRKQFSDDYSDYYPPSWIGLR